MIFYLQSLQIATAHSHSAIKVFVLPLRHLLKMCVYTTMDVFYLYDGDNCSNNVHNSDLFKTKSICALALTDNFHRFDIQVTRGNL